MSVKVSQKRRSTPTRQAVKLKPDYYYGYQRLGRILQQQKRTAEAIAAYRRALEIDPCQTQLQQTLSDLLPQSERLVPVPEADRDRYPRVLVVAPIKFNQQAGGGVTMGNLFRGLASVGDRSDSF